MKKVGEISGDLLTCQTSLFAVQTPRDIPHRCRTTPCYRAVRHRTREWYVERSKENRNTFDHHCCAGAGGGLRTGAGGDHLPQPHRRPSDADNVTGIFITITSIEYKTKNEDTAGGSGDRRGFEGFEARGHAHLGVLPARHGDAGAEPDAAHRVLRVGDVAVLEGQVVLAFVQIGQNEGVVVDCGEVPRALS